jgi:enterochelin esterase-like enzyme
MSPRRALVAGIALLWLSVGVYGTISYGSAYITYRGFPPPKDPPSVAGGRVVRERIFSAALGHKQRFVVYEPPGYASAVARGVHFPVLYLLHGSPGRPMQFIDVAAAGVALDTGIHDGTLRPFLLVMPDGSDGTFRKDTEWADTPHGRYESWVLEVVHAVDSRFATLPGRAYRAIGGESEGGYAAVNIALRHPALFSTAESWSGYALQRRVGPFAHASAATLAANSPAGYVAGLKAQLQRYPFNAYIYCGVTEPALPRRERFAHQLAAVGAHVRFAAFPGGHDWALWRAQTPRMLAFADHWFGSSR